MKPQIRFRIRDEDYQRLLEKVFSGAPVKATFESHEASLILKRSGISIPDGVTLKSYWENSAGFYAVIEFFYEEDTDEVFSFLTRAGKFLGSDLS